MSDTPNHFQDPLLAQYLKAKINPDRLEDAKHIGAKIMGLQDQYQKVENATGVPWDVVAVIHYRESSLNFHTHLHNGDPLTERTVHVPRGRPISGTPPFAWYESAIDALGTHKGVWDIPVRLRFLEAYNGLGYKKRGLPSPYLWSWTDQYTAGKYVADGEFSYSVVDMQCGAVPLMKVLGIT